MAEEIKKQWGGYREGAGRKKGSTGPYKKVTKGKASTYDGRKR